MIRAPCSATGNRVTTCNSPVTVTRTLPLVQVYTEEVKAIVALRPEMQRPGGGVNHPLVNRTFKEMRNKTDCSMQTVAGRADLVQFDTTRNNMWIVSIHGDNNDILLYLDAASDGDNQRFPINDSHAVIGHLARVEAVAATQVGYALCPAESGLQDAVEWHMEVVYVANRCKQTIGSVLEATRERLVAANPDSELRIKTYFMRNESKDGEYIPGTWHQNTIVIVIIWNGSGPPKLPTEEYHYTQYAQRQAGEPPEAVARRILSIYKPYQNIRLVSNAYVGQWCPDCNGYKCRTGCVLLEAKKEYSSRKKARDKREASVMDLGNLEERNDWATRILNALNEACEGDECLAIYGIQPPRGGQRFAATCNTFLKKCKINTACSPGCMLSPCRAVNRANNNTRLRALCDQEEEE